jgi:hypothetical protein
MRALESRAFARRICKVSPDEVRPLEVGVDEIGPPGGLSLGGLRP